MRTVFVVRGGAPAATRTWCTSTPISPLTEKEELICLLKRILERKIEVEGHGWSSSEIQASRCDGDRAGDSIR